MSEAVNPYEVSPAAGKSNPTHEDLRIAELFLQKLLCAGGHGAVLGYVTYAKECVARNDMTGMPREEVKYTVLEDDGSTKSISEKELLTEALTEYAARKTQSRRAVAKTFVAGGLLIGAAWAGIRALMDDNQQQQKLNALIDTSIPIVGGLALALACISVYHSHMQGLGEVPADPAVKSTLTVHVAQARESQSQNPQGRAL